MGVTVNDVVIAPCILKKLGEQIGLGEPEQAYGGLVKNDWMLLGGFLARCLCFDSKIQPTEIPKVPRPIAPSVKKQYHDHIKQLMTSYLRRQTP